MTNSEIIILYLVFVAVSKLYLVFALVFASDFPFLYAVHKNYFGLKIINNLNYLLLYLINLKIMGKYNRNQPFFFFIDN